MLILLCSLSFGMVAQAKPQRQVINFEYVWDSYDLPEREWLTNGGIYHTIMTPHYGHITYSDSSLVGNVYYCGNLVLFDLALFEGLGGGIFEFTGEYDYETAGFYGKIHFKIKDFTIVGKLNCHGTGAFEGKLIKGTFIGALGGATDVQISIWN